MSAIQDDTIGGFNQFLTKQKALPGQATLTLVQFDSQDPYEVIHHVRPLADVPDLTRETFVPRGSTPLLDAIGSGITDLEKSIGAAAESEKPDKVLFVIVTDGQENHSQTFTRRAVEEMIRAKSAGGWEFAFLGADLSAIGDIQAMGIRASSTARFACDAEGVAGAWHCLNIASLSFRENDTFSLRDVDGDERG